MPDMFTISLPIESRKVSYDFYRMALGLEPFGEPAQDGIPEPLQFVLGNYTKLMLVPRDGFGWVVGDDRLASRGSSECLLSVSVPNSADVGSLFGASIAAGATEIYPPSQKPWGYAAMIADPDGHLWMIMVA